MEHYRGKIWDGIQERRLGGFPERSRGGISKRWLVRWNKKGNNIRWNFLKVKLGWMNYKEIFVNGI